MKEPPAELLGFLNKHDPGVQAVALGLRQVVVEEMAPCHEYIFTMRSKVVLVYGPTERAIADAICSLAVFARHVTLTFHRGVHLRDPEGLLRGSGKIMRHVTLRAPADLENAGVRKLLREARKEAGLKRPRGASAADVVTRIKTASPARRSQSPWDAFGFRDDSR